ncbi:hypothetical protein IAU59_005891 [Kwoniella sp. CBS 9459]
MPPIKVAAVQSASVAFDLQATVIKLIAQVAEAKQNGAQLVMFPEAFLGGYPRHLDFRIGARTDADRQWYSRYVAAGVKVPPDAVGRDWLAEQAEVSDDFWAFSELCKIAKEQQVHLSVGIIERSLIGATLWCCNILIGPSGKLLSKHRKVQPTAAERVVWSQGEVVNKDGDHVSDNLPVVATPLGRIGGLICWENLMPLARYVLYQKGVEIYTAPTADGRTTWLPSMQHIALEGRCYVVSANQFHTSKDYPEDYPAVDANKEEVWSRGGSCIVSPLGEILAGPLWDKEGIIYAEIDVDSLAGAKLDFDPVGHYARGNLLTELVKG